MRTQMECWSAKFSSVKMIEASLSPVTASLANGCDAVCAFVNDDCGAETLEALAACGVGCVAMRCAGYDRVDLSMAESLGIVVLRVPAYSPHSVAEHAVALMMALNRQIRSFACMTRLSKRTRQHMFAGNYALSGLVGFDMHGKTCGIIGTGLIGRCTAAILLGMGCRVLAYDPFPNQTARDMGIEYVELEELLASSRDETRHLINKHTISLLKPGAMIINTSRGGLLDTAAAVEGLDSRKIGARSAWMSTRRRAVLGALASRPNVLVTPHMAFLTADALEAIAEVTAENLAEFVASRHDPSLTFTNQVLP
ncbi:D-lactate dehydrogenase [Emiliania huxleyi CCMP1516]|uniref:D-lactate dehydrogenase n=2 Tax=Emiliania huxleyi TaxID=2903 RepID=A0A0D3KJ89_EMIH1|nr:D-lactate dehydrogenase [Emiliania huxleyi CCMP1516]EOD35824.1 D-lactate dehydrogenase [Emiliania huxleyi CCMP1516]|eukprot:XP_005788253.1 D-lactate dehydrogenase [Emiliania huxleyi CCMP1516]